VTGAKTPARTRTQDDLDSTGPAVAPVSAAERGDIPWPGGPAVSRRVWPSVLLSCAAVGALLLLLFVRNHRYFFVDDRMTEIVPKALDIGRMVRRGEAPWLSTDIVNGGGYAVEYLMGIFNPANIVLYTVASLTDDAAFGSFVYVLGHALLLTASAAWLARTVGLTTTWSAAFAISVGFQPYTILWNATAWSQGLVSLSWLVLAVGAATGLHLRPCRRYGWLLLLGVFGTLTSGWPHAIVMLAAFLFVLLVARLRARCPLRGTVWIAVWAAAGAVVSLVAIYPLLKSFEVASRSSSTSNKGNFNVAPLEALLHFSDPAYYGFFLNFEGYSLQQLPHFYVAWFALPVLVLAAPRRLPDAVRPLLFSTMALLAVAVLATLGPERLSVFRFPTRALQYSGFFLLLLVALLVAHGTFRFSARRCGVLLALVVTLALNALQVDPLGIRRVLLAGLLVSVLGTALWLQGRPDLLRSEKLRTVARVTRPAVILVGTVGILAGLAVHHPAGRGEDFGFPHDLTALQPVSRDDYTLFYGGYPPEQDRPEAYSEYRSATMGLMVGDRQVNGYSSLGNRFLRTFLPIDDQGNPPPGTAARFAGADPATGLPWLELLRVDQVIALSGVFDDDLRLALDAREWRREQGKFTATYRRTATYPLPGLVSWTSPSVTVSEDGCERTALHECLRVFSPEGGDVRFARLWLPGYSATLDGKVLLVTRQSEAFVSVRLPSGAKGILELRYSSPGLRPLATLAAFVLVGLAVASWRWQGERPGNSRPFTGRGVARRTLRRRAQPAAPRLSP